MKIAFYILILLFSSCASIFNKPETRIRIYTDTPIALKTDYGTYIIDSEEKILVPRNKKPLEIVVTQDSLRKEIKLLPKNSFQFYSNIFTFGPGFLFDIRSNKRYTYQRNIYFDLRNSKIRRFRPDKKGQVNFIFGLPHVHSFNLSPIIGVGVSSSQKLNTVFWGINLGLEYYYSDLHSIGFNVSEVVDFLFPVPVAVDYDGEHELTSLLYFNLTHNFKLNNFSIGVGVNHSKNTWDYKYPTGTPLSEMYAIRKIYYSFGLTLNTYYRLDKYFNVGLVYKPTFLRIDPNRITVYEHVINLEFAWIFRSNSDKKM